MRTIETAFDGEGGRYHILITTGTRDGVLISLPDFKWSVTVAPHRAPSADWLRSQGFARGQRTRTGNAADCETVAKWLAENWTELMANNPPDPTILVLVGPRESAEPIARHMAKTAGAKVFYLSDFDTDRRDVLFGALPHGTVVAVAESHPRAELTDEWARFCKVHVALVGVVVGKPISITVSGHRLDAFTLPRMDGAPEHEDDRRPPKKSKGVRNERGLRIDCPHCGRNWSPSMDESETFPGSACDTGECVEGLD